VGERRRDVLFGVVEDSSSNAREARRLDGRAESDDAARPFSTCAEIVERV
jgi:hypothetical protein